MNDRTSAERLHGSTKHGTPPTDPDALVPFRRMDPHNAPAPFKEYHGLETIELPRRVAPSSASAKSVLSGQKGPKRPMDRDLVSTLLFLTAGVTRVMELPDRTLYFRAAMSAGNLHPIEVYLILGQGAVGDLPAGLYHYSPPEHTLGVLRRGDYRGAAGVAAPVAVALTGIPWRTTWKYAERGWRHLYWDAGTMLANLLAVADAGGLEHRTLLGFDDRALADLLGVDATSEMPLALVEIGHDGSEAVPAPVDVEPLSLDTARVAPMPIDLQLVEEAQARSSLTTKEVGAWREAAGEIARSAPSSVDVPDGPDDPIEEVVLRRGSTRSMLQESVPSSHLKWPIAASARAAGIDVIPEATLLDNYLTVHGVEGLAPGAYTLAGRTIREQRYVDDIRERSASLCLGQDLGGDSAYTVYHVADLEPTLSALGSRGYRVAQLEAGIVSGRLALCAFTLGLGATGLTFFDDAVSSFFGTSSQPMLVTAVGVPSGSPAPAGTPGEPVRLRR